MKLLEQGSKEEFQAPGVGALLIDVNGYYAPELTPRVDGGNTLILVHENVRGETLVL